MSENNSVGLTLFAEFDNLFQDFSPDDESTIAGGGHGHKQKCHHGKIGKWHCHSYHWYKKNKHHFQGHH